VRRQLTLASPFQLQRLVSFVNLMLIEPVGAHVESVLDNVLRMPQGCIEERGAEPSSVAICA
jgi:hypothetical protein